jgi:urea transporter
MQIAIQAFVYLSVIGGIVIGILLYYHKQTPSVWVTFATLVSLSLAFCLYWQNSILEKEKNTQPTKIPKLEEPTKQLTK